MLFCELLKIYPPFSDTLPVCQSHNPFIAFITQGFAR